MSIKVKIVDIPSNTLNDTNLVYCNEKDAITWKKQGKYLRLLGQNSFFVYLYEAHASIAEGQLGMNTVQRLNVFCSLGEQLKLEIIEKAPNASVLFTEVSWKIKKKSPEQVSIDTSKFTEYLKQKYLAHTFTSNQKFSVKYEEWNFMVVIKSVLVVGKSKSGKIESDEFAVLTNDTELMVSASYDSNIQLSETGVAPDNDKRNLIKVGFFDPEVWEIGGLSREFHDLFRKAFSSRLLTPATVKKFKMKHTKGVLLYGPPGTGKTTLARRLGEMLNCKIKKVSGASILDKWVGEAEKKIRELFAEAELEYKQKGDNSQLHMIIIDEIDAICRKRGASTNNTGDTIVNQLLDKIDGTDSINNVLLVGMTNRIELIDDAVIRSGRIDLHLEIGLPDEKGRLEVLRVHTKHLRDTPAWDNEIHLEDYAKVTKNYSGADLENVVRAAWSFALTRHTSLQDMSHVMDEDKIRVTRADFDKAVTDVKPMFGVDNDTIQTLMPQPFIVWSDEYQALLNQVQVYMSQVASSPVTRLVTCLIQGPRGSGKTGLAARITKQCPYPFIKVVSPETLIGMESNVASTLHKVFLDAYRSPTALIILDNIERIISYSRVGPIYQNSALQALLTLVSKVPPKTRLMVLATCSEPRAMEQLGITDSFHVHHDIPLIKMEDQTMTIREILMTLETDRQELGAEAYKRRCEKLGPPFQALHDLE